MYEHMYMGSRKMALINLFAEQQWVSTGVENRLVDPVVEGEEGTDWKTSTETYTSS